MPDAQLAVALLCVVAAAAVIVRRAWNLVRSGGAGGCGSGCGSCPAAQGGEPDVVPLRTDFGRRP